MDVALFEAITLRSCLCSHWPCLAFSMLWTAGLGLHDWNDGLKGLKDWGSVSKTHFQLKRGVHMYGCTIWFFRHRDRLSGTWIHSFKEVYRSSYCCDLPPFFHNPQSQFPAAEILESINKSYRLPSHPIPGVISTDNGSTVRHQHAVKSSSTEADKVFPIIECSDNLDGSVNRKDYYRNNCSLL